MSRKRRKRENLKNVSIEQIKKNLDFNINLILDYIKEREGRLCSDIFTLDISKWKIVEICEYFDLSRFKVKKYIAKAKKLSKSVLIKEGLYGKNKKISRFKKKK